MTSLLRHIRRLLPFPAINGYDDERVAETVLAKTRLYTPTQYSDPFDYVLDFGGGAGVHYLQRQPCTKWAIVETHAMAKACQGLTTPRLAWFTSIGEARHWLGQTPDLIFSNGALQYCRHPYEALASLCALNAPNMIWERLELDSAQPYLQHSFLSDHGPGPASGPEADVYTWVRPIPRDTFLRAHRAYYGEQSFGNGECWTFRRKQHGP